MDFNKFFSDQRFEFLPKSTVPELWLNAYNQLPFQPVTYHPSVIDYEFEYYRSGQSEYVDFSCVILSGKRPVALWPVFLNRATEKKPGVNRLVVQPPLSLFSFDLRLQGSISSVCLSVLRKLVIELNLSGWETTESALFHEGLTSWHIACKKAGADTSILYKLYVDLRLPYSDIKSKFRKSYRSLVKPEVHGWNIHVETGASIGSRWAEFRALHRRVSGKVTRSIESWNKQFDMLLTGSAFLVYLCDDTDRMIGGGFFQHSRDEGFYAVGVYDRLFFNKPVGHHIQFRAIDEFKNRGVSWYHLGLHLFPASEREVSDKEIAISHFKSGFATHTIPAYLLRFNN